MSVLDELQTSLKTIPEETLRLLEQTAKSGNSSLNQAGLPDQDSTGRLPFPNYVSDPTDPMPTEEESRQAVAEGNYEGTVRAWENREGRRWSAWNSERMQTVADADERRRTSELPDLPDEGEDGLLDRPEMPALGSEQGDSSENALLNRPEVTTLALDEAPPLELPGSEPSERDPPQHDLPADPATEADQLNKQNLQALDSADWLDRANSSRDPEEPYEVDYATDAQTQLLERIAEAVEELAEQQRGETAKGGTGADPGAGGNRRNGSLDLFGDKAKIAGAVLKGIGGGLQQVFHK